jgi:hypothetical protein
VAHIQGRKFTVLQSVVVDIEIILLHRNLLLLEVSFFILDSFCKSER